MSQVKSLFVIYRHINDIGLKLSFQADEMLCIDSRFSPF